MPSHSSRTKSTKASGGTTSTAKKQSSSSASPSPVVASKSKTGGRGGSSSLHTVVKSNSSTSSNESVGIGLAHGAAHPAPADAALRFRLMPEGLGTNVFNVYDQVAYDCLVTVVSCERHGTVALTAPTDWTRMYAYFPFIPLQETFTWKRISRDGLALILKTDAVVGEDVDQAQAVALPDYTTTWLGVTRLQLSGGVAPVSSSSSSSSVKFSTRLMQHVQLQTPASVTAGADGAAVPTVVKCCIDNSRIRWLKMAEIVAGGGCDNLWSDEVVAVCRYLTGVEARPDFIAEIDGRVAMPTAAEDQALLRSINWSEKLVTELLEDYVRHMYPAVTMSLNSLAAFLEKFSLVGKKDRRVGRLFKAFSAGADALSFPQLLIGLAAMDPETTNDQESRARIIFNYYDTEGKGALTVAQVKEMCCEATSVSPSKSRIQNLVKAFSGGTSTLNLEQFTEALRSENVSPKADGLLRFEKSFFEAKRTSRRHSSRSSAGDSSSSDRQSLGKGGKKAAGTGKGSSTSAKSSKSSQSKTSVEGCCFAHGSKRYEFGLHTVTLDSTGRCVDPRIIDDHWVTRWGSKEMTRNRFSVENVFRHNSTANIFIDLVRDFKEKQMDQPDCPGMLTAEEDLDTLYSYLETLARQTCAVLRGGAKLLRLGGCEHNSIFVVGDLQGGLRDLLHIESMLFRSAPVTGNSVLFLGNYTGPAYSYGFEVLLYLFALKVAMPNNFHLLRGKNEMRTFNGVHLKGELVNKFGDDMGEKILDLFNLVFDCMPVAAVLNESVLCTHSGIPNLVGGGGKRRPLIAAFQAEVANKTDFADPRKEMPIGYEMMVNIPVRYAHSNEEKTAAKARGFEASVNGLYHYYSSKAFEDFMAANGLQFHLRSHNPVEEGYALCFSNRSLTVHSCRRFNATTLPYIAVLQVGGSQTATAYTKIRPIRFSTVEMTTSKKKSTASKNH